MRCDDQDHRHAGAWQPMIARIIELWMRNRFMVLLLTALAVGEDMMSIFHIRLDAIPDLSDVQVIVTTEYPGQNPEVVDEQVTYPLAAPCSGRCPGSKVVRGFSMFEQSFVYVLFEEGTDITGPAVACWNTSILRETVCRRAWNPSSATRGLGWVYQFVRAPVVSPNTPRRLAGRRW